MIPEQKVRQIRDTDSLLTFLREELNWQLPEGEINDLTFEWTGSELNLSEDVQEKLKDGVVHQLQPFAANQPWGIFIIDFTIPNISVITLRQILRRLVSKRRAQNPDVPSWNSVNLLFICLYGQDGFSFAHFMGDKPYGARLSTFSWHPGDPIRTLCEYNLPALEYRDAWNLETWLTEWQKAFDVEKVNKIFYGEIARLFYRLTGKCGHPLELKLPSVADGAAGQRYYEEFAVRLIGRTIFCWFLKHKKSDNGVPLIPDEVLSRRAVHGWPDYYHSVLEPLFFEAMNKRNGERKLLALPQVQSVPFLNGGLFERHPNDYYEGCSNYALKIPDDWFVDLFSVLERFNFTISENSSIDVDVSVDPEMLGRIFENLLAEVNPDTGETARKATGSYYTPRVIVDHMVEQSLRRYLTTKTNLGEERIECLLAYGAELVDFSEEQKLDVTAALSQIRIIDPACGSGAFPIGILHRMLVALEKVDPKLEIWRSQFLKSLDPMVRQTIEKNIRRENWAYIRKLMIIRDSIYGVDIQPIAVEIAKLRCFLSLVVDEHVLDAEENRGIEPLPNLEFKFVAANALIGLPPMTQSAFGITEAVNRLKELRDDYLRSAGAEKVQIEKKFRATQQKLFEENMQWASAGTLVKQLTEWDPFSYDSCGWFHPGWMFGVSNGFDVVIANPPYIKEYVNRRAFDGLRDSPYYQGKMDIWYLFACQGIDHLKKGGVLTFIAQNNWVTSFGASKLRNKVISDTQILALLDFGDYKIFESSGIQTMVMVFAKDDVTDGYRFDYRRIVTNDPSLEDVLDLLNKVPKSCAGYLSPEIQRGNLGDTVLTFSQSAEQDILENMRSKSNFRFSESDIAQGIVPNPDVVNKTNIERLPRERIAKYSICAGEGVFVVEKDTFEHLDPTEKKYLRPLYEPNQMSKYHLSPQYEKQIIYITKANYQDDCPTLLRHLQRYMEIMAARRENVDGRLEYFHLHWPRKSYFFEEGPKILSVRKCSQPTFAYSELEAYVMMAINVIKTDRIDLKYLTALLNSKLIAFWLRNKGKMQGNNYQIDKEPLLAIPLVNPSAAEQAPIVELVDRILMIAKQEGYSNTPRTQAKIKDLARKIDPLIYHLYGLSPDAVELVKKSTNAT